MDFFIRGNRSNFALSQKKPTQSQVRSTSVSNPFQVRSLYRRYMPHDREFARQFCRLLSNHGNIYTNFDKHHLQHLRGLLSFAKIKTIWHSKYGITKGVSNSDSPWRRKESQWGRDSRPQLKRREDDDKQMHQISALGQKRDEQRERIVLSGYGALGICKSKKVQYIVYQK